MAVSLQRCSVTEDDALRWAAVLRRDRDWDGRFVTGVLSTGIYCRPSCAARHPGRDNVRFFASSQAARDAGLRACKRCLPDDIARDEKAVADALVLLSGEAPPRLEALARAVGYSPAHFSRTFARAVGMTPSAYVRAFKAERSLQALEEGASVTEAVYKGGFSAPSRFYAAVGKRIAMSPSAWSKGGAGVVIRWAVLPTDLGPMLLAATDLGVCRLSFNEGREALEQRFPQANLQTPDENFDHLAQQVLAIVANPATDPSVVPLDIGGTPFQRDVWQALRAIPPGETRSYAELARSVGRPGADRAAGSANGANCVAVLIPCHRVIRSDGSLGGYAYGLDIKRRLLEAEGAVGAFSEDVQGHLPV